MLLSLPSLFVPERKSFNPRIAIIENEGLFNELIATVCRIEFDTEVVARATRGGTGMSEILKQRPDLVLLDICLPDLDGLAVAKVIQTEIKHCRIIIMSALQDPLTFVRIRKLGVHGYLDKNEASVNVLRAAISAVIAGGRYFSPRMTTTLSQLQKNPNAFHLVLSEHEQSVLALIGNAYTDEEIAGAFRVKPTTAQSCRSEIMRKLSIHSTPKLIQYAHEMGFARVGRYRPPLQPVSIY